MSLPAMTACLLFCAFDKYNRLSLKVGVRPGWRADLVSGGRLTARCQVLHYNGARVVRFAFALEVIARSEGLRFGLSSFFWMINIHLLVMS